MLSHEDVREGMVVLVRPHSGREPFSIGTILHNGVWCSSLWEFSGRLTTWNVNNEALYEELI